MKAMKMTPLTLFWAVLLLSIGSVACGPSEAVVNAPEDGETGIVLSSEYISLASDEMIDQADLVFQGQVTAISTTQFNQESGAYWDEGRPYHTITFQVLRPIVDTINVGQELTVTVWGNNPTEESVPVEQNGQEIRIFSNAEHDLQVGDTVIAFVERRELMWREGKHEALVLLGVPSESYYRLQAGDRYLGGPARESITVEELVDRVAEQRSVSEQPAIEPESTPSE
ncbi:MAG TPA: hypothetical protein PLH39_01590 [Promineifilum sp.]|nr:hypothetical protein [Promineifilum sp.]